MGLETFPPRTRGSRADSAKYIVPLNKFERPRLFIIGGASFEWPLGTEDLILSGGPTAAEHRYIGASFIDVKVVHRDALKIELSGEFPGLTGAANARALRQLLIANDPPDFKRLELPGIFINERKVVAGQYTFQRSKDAPPGTFTYTCEFTVNGIGDELDLGGAEFSDGNKNAPSGQAPRYFTVRDGARTLRAIASNVYRNPNKWRTIYDLNKTEIHKKLPNVPMTQIPTKALPLGMKLRY